MSRTIMLIPIGKNVNLTGISLALIQGMKKKNICPGFFKPIKDINLKKNKHVIDTVTLLKKFHPSSIIDDVKSINLDHITNNVDYSLFLNNIMILYQRYISTYSTILIEGITSIHNIYNYNILNSKIACFLNASVIFVVNANQDYRYDEIDSIKFPIKDFSNLYSKNILGVIFSQLNSVNLFHKKNDLESLEMITDSYPSIIKNKNFKCSLLYSKIVLPILGLVPVNTELIKVPLILIFQYLNIKSTYSDDINNVFIKYVTIYDRPYKYISSTIMNKTLVIVPFYYFNNISDNDFTLLINNKETIIIFIITKQNNIYRNRINSLFHNITKEVKYFIYIVDSNIIDIILAIKKIDFNIYCIENSYINKLQNHIFYSIRTSIFSNSKLKSDVHDICSSNFKSHIIFLAQKKCARIILPEGYEPRIIQSASICADLKLAHCILLGNPKHIKNLAFTQGITLNKNVEIIDPDSLIKEKYIARLITLRKQRGMNLELAKKQLKHNIVLSTLMLELNEVDGLVSGSVNTTADTIRPALQLIKSKFNFVSSIFFILLPKKLLIYGDCAINPDPDALQLSNIAMQSVDSALQFNILPRVAMLSYFTGSSGIGESILKINQAIKIIKHKRPNLIIDGPIQYDAAIIPKINLIKSPHSPLLGNANIFIFPDLNSGNITYKAVQHAGNATAIGPILQGLSKPVNDLSRGASVEDIVYTIAITAIQASHLITM